MSKVRVTYPDWTKLSADDRLVVMLGNVLDDRTHYERHPVLDCELEGAPLDICEQLFCKYNDNPDIKLRSMSCGDIIEIDGVEYVCRTVGWSKIDEHE